MEKQPYDTWLFTGDEETYTTITAGDAVDGGMAGDKYLTTIPSNDHGFKASSGSLQSLCYIQGTTNYDGLKRIHAVGTNTITIVAKYVAETFGGTETIKTMYGADHPFEFLGFEVKLSAVGGASENLTAILDADAGAAFDVQYYSQDMNAVQYISEMFTVPKKCKAGDKIDIAYANTNDKTWSVKLFTRRLV